MALEGMVRCFPFLVDSGASISLIGLNTIADNLSDKIFLGDITLPLLGFDYLDDCSYHHTIGGDLLVSAVAKDIGKRFYPDNVLNFNSILDQYEKAKF